MSMNKKGLPARVIPRQVESYPGAKSKTQRVGYTDFKKRLGRVLMAGENLAQYRADSRLYDVVGDTDVDNIDWRQVKVRSLGFGLAEYSEFSRAVAERKAEITERFGVRNPDRRKANNADQSETPPAKPAESSPSGGRGGARAAGGGDSAPERSSGVTK